MDAARPWRPTVAIAWRPTVADVLFVALVARGLFGQVELLNDPGTPWHIQLGLDTWQNGPPIADTYSFTRSGETWYSQYWLADLALAGAYGAAGWGGVTVAATLTLAWTYRTLYRIVLNAGANLAWAAGLTLLAFACGTAHFLARPHLLSLLAMLCVATACDRFQRRQSRAHLLTPAILLLWANVHGAFLAGCVVLLVSFVAAALSPRDREWRRRVAESAAVAALASAATLMNPYGWRLHQQLWRLLTTSGVRDLIDEWQPPGFEPGNAPFVLLVAITCLALGAVSWSRHRERLDVADSDASRVSLFDLLQSVLWTFFAARAVRQVSFMAIVLTPIVGRASSGLWTALVKALSLRGESPSIAGLGKRLDEWAVLERQRTSIAWSLGGTGVLALMTLGGVSAWGMKPVSPAAKRFPVAAMDALAPRDCERMFHELNWGGYLIHRSAGRVPVFIDDRFELYGRDLVLEYLRAREGTEAWDRLDREWQFENVLISPASGLARRLRNDPSWTLDYEDQTAIHFHRAKKTGTPDRSPRPDSEVPCQRSLLYSSTGGCRAAGVPSRRDGRTFFRA